MTFRVIRFGVLIWALAVSACAGIKPDTLNSYDREQKPDSEVALVRMVSSGLAAIDGAGLPQHPDADHYYYREIRLLPGRHTLALRNEWGASVLVSPTGRVGGSESFTLDLQAGHLYELHSDRTHGAVQLFFWIEDATANTVVAGTKYGGSDDKKLITLNWKSDAKRIVLLSPHFDLSEQVFGGPAPRADWNESGRVFALKHIDSHFAAKGIETILDEETNSEMGCSPDTETGVAPACAERLRQRFQADYGLFLEVRDVYSSPGVVAGRAAVAVLYPFILPALVFREEGEAPPACMSLFDTNTGEVIWRHCINRVTNFAPNWQDDRSAERAIRELLSGFPPA